MTAIDKKTEKTILSVARTLYPYDFLDDSYYMVVIDSINRDSTQERLELLKAGAAELSNGEDQPFYDLPEEHRVRLLKKIESTPFFKDIRSTTVREVFNNPAIWPHFGYEGPSAQKGGYVKRGFDNSSWITDD